MYAILFCSPNVLLLYDKNKHLNIRSTTIKIYTTGILIPRKKSWRERRAMIPSSTKSGLCLTSFTYITILQITASQYSVIIPLVLSFIFKIYFIPINF